MADKRCGLVFGKALGYVSVMLGRMR